MLEIYVCFLITGDLFVLVEWVYLGIVTRPTIIILDKLWFHKRNRGLNSDIFLRNINILSILLIFNIRIEMFTVIWIYIFLLAFDVTILRLLVKHHWDDLWNINPLADNQIWEIWLFISSLLVALNLVPFFCSIFPHCGPPLLKLKMGHHNSIGWNRKKEKWIGVQMAAQYIKFDAWATHVLWGLDHIYFACLMWTFSCQFFI